MAIDTSIYSMVRPPPSLFNQLGEAQALRGGEQALALGKQRQRMNEQQIQQNDFQQQEQQRAIALQQKIGEVMSQSVGQDGAPDEAKLRHGFLSDPQLAPHWGTVEANITKAKEATAKLRETFQKVGADDDEKVAAMDPILNASNYDPAVAAKLLQEVGPGFSPEKQRDLLQQIQTNPTPQAVQQIFAPRAAADKTQATNAHLAAETAGAAQLAADRKAEEADKQSARRLANASNALYLAAQKGKEQYADAYAGLSPELQGQFDAPARFNENTAQNALDVARTPQQISEGIDRDKRDAANKANQEAIRKEQERRDKAADWYRKQRLAVAGNTKKDEDLKQDTHEWDVLMGKAKATYDAEKNEWDTRNPFAKTTGEINPKDPQPKLKLPPDLSEFHAQREEARGHASPKKSVTQAQLEAVAKLRGTSVEVQRKRAEAEGFTIAPK
jgi:hypothetical protein